MRIVRNQSNSQKSLRSEHAILALIVALGVALRLYCLQFYLDNGGLDSMWYTYAGVQISRGGLLSPLGTFKGPLLTLLLGLSMRVFGSTYMVSKFVSLVAGSLLPIVVFFLGSELFGKKTGLLSALLVSVNPLLIFYHGLVYREPLYSLTWTSCLYFAICGFKGKTLYSIIGGILFVLSSVTIQLGIFAGIGFILYFSFHKILKINKPEKIVRKNLDIFFLSALFALVPFLAKDYIAYREPFIQWYQLELFTEIGPFGPSALMWAYVGLMALSIPYMLAFRVYHVDIRFRRSSLFASSRNRSEHTCRKIRIAVYAIIVTSATLVFLYEVLRGPGLVAKVAMGALKLFEALIFPESMGLLLILFIFALIYLMRSSVRARSDVALIFSAFLFSAVGLTWGLVSHYEYWFGFGFEEIFAFLPRGPLDNAFRYVSSYLPLFMIFAGYGILLLAKSIRKLVERPEKSRTRRTSMLEVAIVSILIISIAFQFSYANSLSIAKAQRSSSALEERYNLAVDWLSNQGSPAIYSFNSMLKELYGESKVVLLNGESLLEIARRASSEKVEFIVSDVFGAYSEAQLALFFGGFSDDPSRVGLDRFQIVYSQKSWPMIQIFKISVVDPSNTALVVQHENWGQKWISFLSESYLVDVIDDEEDLTPLFSWDYKLIVLTDIKRHLTDVELNILQQKVASGVVLIVNGLSPAYMDLGNSGHWIGATNFVEAPGAEKWRTRFTENALSVSSEIETNKSYALYSSSMWSSPTGLTGIEENVVVYATRVEDEAIVISANAYVDGIVIFSGVRSSFIASTATDDYITYTDFIQNLLKKAEDETFFP